MNNGTSARRDVLKRMAAAGAIGAARHGRVFLRRGAGAYHPHPAASRTTARSLAVRPRLSHEPQWGGSAVRASGDGRARRAGIFLDEVEAFDRHEQLVLAGVAKLEKLLQRKAEQPGGDDDDFMQSVWEQLP